MRINKGDRVPFLEDFDPAGKVTPIMKNGALGDAYSEMGEFDKALSLYKKAGSYDNDFLTPYYLMKYGLLAEKQGDTNSAKSAYEQIHKDYPDSQQGRDIEKYLAKFQ